MPVAFLQQRSQSDRFGLLILLITGSYGLYQGMWGSPLRATLALVLLLFLGGLFMLLPSGFALLYSGWMALGHLLGLLFSPLIMGVLFFGLFTPLAVFYRWRHGDPLQIRQNRALSSYWVNRSEDPVSPESLKHQF